MGNTAVLKPSLTAVHETYLMMKIWREAGGCSAAGAAAVANTVAHILGCTHPRYE